MKKLLLLIAFAVTIQGFSQQLPDASPRSVVSQKVGLTDIELNYSRPSVKSRDIFGGLIPLESIGDLEQTRIQRFHFQQTPVLVAKIFPLGPTVLQP